MMSDDGNSYALRPDFDNSSMEIVVETLTGTTFEMTVSSTDTIMSIKNKIQRVEGIPVSQQHLLHRLIEMNNDERLCDHGVTAGSTLRLVLSMRGGPISTRRLASTEHQLAWKELKEYVDNTREDIIDKLPPGAKVTVFLFRDGENINLIRVVENEDGTCYPYSDSWPPAKNSSRESAHAKTRECTTENNAMMYKMSELRRKMEGLSLQRKTKKPGRSVPEKADAESFASEATAQRNDIKHNVQLGATSDHLRVGKSLSEIYSDRLMLLEHRRNSRTNTGHRHRTHRVDSKPEDVSLPARSCNSLASPSITILEEESESAMNKKESDFSPPSPISVASGDANTVTMSQIPSLPGTSRNVLHLAHVPHVVLQERPDRPNSTPENYDPKAREFCNVLFGDVTDGSHKVKFSISNRRQSLEFSDNKSNVTNGTSSNGAKEKSYKRESPVAEDFETGFSNSLYNNTSFLSSYTSNGKLNSADLDSVLGGRILENNTRYTEGRTPLYGRRARVERTRNFDTSSDQCGFGNVDYVSTIKKIQNDEVSKNQPPQVPVRRHFNIVSSLQSRQNADSGSFEFRPYKLSRRRTDFQASTSSIAEERKETIEPLPVLVPKKPPRTRCLFCNKRLNITTIHTCPCGGIFCSQHRYAEVHGCHYDYKTEGRKFLEQANPLVAAPKLPKI